MDSSNLTPEINGKLTKNALTAYKKVSGLSNIIDGIPYSIELDIYSYKNNKTRARFICGKYGEFWSLPYTVINCGVRHPDSKESRRKQKCLKKYGVDHPLKSKNVIDKIKKTNLDKYGVECSLHSKEGIVKKEKTYLQKYGVTNPFNSPEIQEKIRENNLQKFGCHSLLSIPSIREKGKITMEKRYGVTNPMFSEKIKQKLKKSNIKSLGVGYPMQSDDVKQKRNLTNMKRYGNACSLHGKEQEMKTNLTIEVKKKEGTWFSRFGKEEKKLKELLESIINIPFLSNRTVLDSRELDMYCKELNLAVEYCGLYWHTEDSPTKRDRNYHNNKRLKCEEQNIRLITIFEDEWLNREEQVKNYLRFVLGSYDKKIFARKTQFKEIPKEKANNFLDTHHIQGKTRGQTHYFGLIHSGELIAVMTFGCHPRNVTIQNVLSRFAIKGGYSIPGGASKLFKNACKVLPKGEIISWSDNRWSQGNVYKKLGFELEEELPPDYSYFDYKNGAKKGRVSKQSQQKNKTNCPKDLTEKEWSLQNGLWRIWDCGKKRWVFYND